MPISLRLIFMLVFTPTACAVAVKRPFYGLLALVAMYYFRPEVWGAPTWFRPQMWLTVAVGVGWLSNLREFRWSSLMGLAAFIVVVFFATSFVAVEDSGAAYDGAVVMMKLVVVMLLSLNLIDTPQKLNQFLWANVLGFVYNLKSIYITGFSGGDVNQTRVDVGVGQGGGSNYIAMICAIAFAIAYVRWLNGGRRERLLAGAMMFAYLVALIVTGSRAGYLSLAAVGLFFLVRSNKRMVGALTLIGLVVVFFAVVPQAHLDRFKNIGTGRGDDSGAARDFSAESRILLWKGATRMFVEHPLAGVGIDNFPLMSPRYVGFYASRSYSPYIPGQKGRGFVTHSTWFQTIAEGGVLVALPFFGCFVIAFLNLRRVRRSKSRDPRVVVMKTQAVQLEAVFLSFVVSSTFGSHIKMDFLWWYFGAVSALLMMLVRIEAGETAVRRRAHRAAIAAVRAAEPAVGART